MVNTIKSMISSLCASLLGGKEMQLGSRNWRSKAIEMHIARIRAWEEGGGLPHLAPNQICTTCCDTMPFRVNDPHIIVDAAGYTCFRCAKKTPSAPKSVEYVDGS